MTISLKLIDFQKAQNEIKKALNQLVTDKFVTVGIHEGSQQPEDGDLTMAELGAIQHFGTEENDGFIPERRWLDVGVESGKAEYVETLAEGVAKGTAPSRVLAQVGNLAVGYTQKYIDDFTTPANAPSTIAKKGSSHPLIDTGAMKQSVTFVMQNKKPEEGL